MAMNNSECNHRMALHIKGLISQFQIFYRFCSQNLYTMSANCFSFSGIS